MSDGAQAVWSIKEKERCQYIRHEKVEGQMWGSSFMTHDQTLALTYDNQKQTGDCENNTLKITQQGIAFTIIDNVKQFDYEKLIPAKIEVRSEY